MIGKEISDGPLKGLKDLRMMSSFYNLYIMEVLVENFIVLYTHITFTSSKEPSTTCFFQESKVGLVGGMALNNTFDTF